jgi:RNA polymerase sigma-70 factor (ECF subfamily)
METQTIIPHLFRTEYNKITAVLCKLFGIEYIELAEDIASDTFLMAAEMWGLKGLPENPTAWLYTVAKNKAKDHFRRDSVFRKKIVSHLKQQQVAGEEAEPEIDLSGQNIQDSQLKMIFAICHPSLSSETQVGLALRILCGFGIDEIAAAFLTNRETINKRLFRGKEKLRAEKVEIAFPDEKEIGDRLQNVATTLYLLFNEGYYSASQDMAVRKDLCLEAMRLTNLLAENEKTGLPFIHALLSLMCFHASRFAARVNAAGDRVLYQQQDESLWDQEFILKGNHYLNRAATGQTLTKYHLEAGIAYWHTIKSDSKEKWENILQLYNRLLQIEYSPIAALNRTYALSKANGITEAICEAEKLQLTQNHLYHFLLGELYHDINKEKALFHLQQALLLSRTVQDKNLALKKISLLDDGN